MKTKAHEHRWVSIKPGYPQKLCKCGYLKVGTHTVLLSDLVRYTSTKAASVAGELGMNVSTGRPSAFIGGVDSPLAAVSDVTGGGSAVMTFGGIAVGSTARLLAWRSEPDSMVPFPHQGTRIIAPRAGTLKKLHATRLGAISNGDTMTVLKNTAPTSLVAAFAGVALSATDLVNTVAVIAGDIIEIEYSSGTPATDAYQTAMEFA